MVSTNTDLKKRNVTVTLDNSNSKRDLSHYFAIYLWIGWLNFYLVLIYIALPLLFVFSKVLFTIVIGIVILLAILPINRKLQPQICYDFGAWLVKKGAEYCQTRVVFENVEEVKKSSPAIFALEPHDVLPISLSFFNDPLKAIPGHKCAGLVTSICFSIPIMRHIYTWANAYSVDKKSMIKLISDGVSPALCPGGAQEVAYIDIHKEEYVLYLNSRLGFIKLAYQFGIPIIPVFAFGLRQSFYLWLPKNQLIQKIGRKLGFLPAVFFGLWGSVLGPPKPCQYVNVIGRPIHVPKNANPTEAELRDIQAKYIVATKDLFDDYKGDYGMSNFTLRII